MCKCNFYSNICAKKQLNSKLRKIFAAEIPVMFFFFKNAKNKPNN